LKATLDKDKYFGSRLFPG